MPKLLNKSISLVISVIVSAVIASIAMEKIMLFMSNSSFGILDSTFTCTNYLKELMMTRMNRQVDNIQPYYIGTHGHPEFKSRPNRAHPLFAGVVMAAVKRKESMQ